MHTSEILGKSAKGRDISLVTLGKKENPNLVLIGGIHGDEPEGSIVVEDFISNAKNQSSAFGSCVYVIPRYNPDGLEKNDRTNGNGVDLNRNFPSGDWNSAHKSERYFPGPKPASESETKALVSLLKKTKPYLVIHCHTYVPQINYTGEISKKWAQMLAVNFPYPITDNIGYPTPGSLGQYCHLNLKTACVCIELPEQVERKKAWELVGSSLLEIARRGP